MSQDDKLSNPTPAPVTPAPVLPSPVPEVTSAFDGAHQPVAGESVLLLLDGQGRPRPAIQLADRRPPPVLKMDSGKYEILELIGAGGMGRVYLAYDHDLQRRVALKMMQGMDPERTRRFLEEAQVMAQLDHPNIVPVHDVGLTRDQQPFYTMRLVQGLNLGITLSRLRAGDRDTERQYSLARRMQILVQIGQAVGYAHSKGVVHRDLKPANVMLGDHGEVQVMDWGLSRVIREGSVVTTLGSRPEASGRLIGTPSYMAPEQARGLEFDHRADIYALGTVLYELLTLRTPFQAGDIAALIRTILRDSPQPPRQIVPGVPPALEALALHALEKRPSDRPRSVDELVDGLRTWLEAAADRAKRHELAEAKTDEGAAKLAELGRLRQELHRREVAAARIAKKFEGWEPAAAKGDLIDAHNALRTARRQLASAETDAMTTLEKALAFEDNPRARELLADNYWERFREAEAQGDEYLTAALRDRVAAYHDGKYSRELAGHGSLALDSDPAGATVELSELVEDGFVTVAAPARVVGTTPLAPVELAMGSYLAVVRKPGFRALRYPVEIGRNRDVVATVRLLTDDAIGAELIHIPAGTFHCGGDPEALDLGLDRAEVWLDDYLIATHPITIAHYVEFLNGIVATESIAAARARSPRFQPEEPSSSYFIDDGHGGLTFPEVDPQGDRWHPDWPVFSVSWHDAVAYCAWRSRRDQRVYRLPDELEWEKAARGVDGRWFPWGWRFDPSLCNMNSSLRERSSPTPITAFETDVSVYGLRGAGGNTCDWTTTETVEGEGDSARPGRVIRGGSWSHRGLRSRVTCRGHHQPGSLYSTVGFRLAADPVWPR